MGHRYWAALKAVGVMVCILTGAQGASAQTFNCVTTGFGPTTVGSGGPTSTRQYVTASAGCGTTLPVGVASIETFHSATAAGHLIVARARDAGGSPVLTRLSCNRGAQTLLNRVDAPHGTTTCTATATIGALDISASISVTSSTGSTFDGRTTVTGSMTPAPVTFTAAAPIMTLSGPATAGATFDLTLESDQPLDFSTISASDIGVVGTGVTVGAPVMVSSTVATFPITVTVDAPIGFIMPANSVAATTGLTNPAQVVSNTINADGLGPRGTISALPTLLGLAGANVAMTFDEPVIGDIDPSDFSTSQIVVNSVTRVGPDQFTLNVAASGNSTVASLQMNVGAVTDAAGNANRVSNFQTTRTIATRPQITFNSASVTRDASGNPTVLARFDFTEFSGDPAFIDNSSLAVITGGTQLGTSFSYAAGFFTVSFRPAGGPATIAFPDGFMEAQFSGNGSPAFGPALVGDFDLTPPTVLSIERQTPTEELINTDVTTWRVTFSEDVTNVSGTPFSFSGTITGGSNGTRTVNVVPVSGSVYDLVVDHDFTATVTAANFRVGVVNTGNIRDLAGNLLDTSSVPMSEEYRFDFRAPTAMISSPSGGVVGPGSFTLNVSFNEDVTGLQATDFMGTNVSVSGLSGSGRTYEITVDVVGNGVANVTLPSGSAQDAAGNGNSSAVANFIVDQLPPTPDIRTVTSLYGLSTNRVWIEFGEAVTGFELADLEFTNLAASNFQALSESQFTFTVVATGLGPAVIRVPAGVATDLAGNGNVLAEETASATTVVPAWSLRSLSDPGPARTYVARFDFLSGGSATIFTQLQDPGFTLTGADLVGIVPDPNFARLEVVFTPTASNPSITFATDAFRANSTLNRTVEQTIPLGMYDVDPPTVSISGTQTFPEDPYLIFITFSEPVIAFEEGDIVGNRANISDFVNECGTGACANFSAVVTANPGFGFSHSVEIPAGVARDVAGNLNLAGASALIPPPDGTQPVVTITGVPDGFTGPETATITFDWGEEVLGFTDVDIMVTGGTIGPISGGRQVWTAELTVDGDTNVIVEVQPEAAQDATGTLSEAATVTGTFATNTIAEELIRDFLTARSTALIAAQPDLARLLGNGGPSGNIQVTRGAGVVDLHTGTEGPVWATLDAQWSDFDGFETSYTHLTFGSHLYLQDETLLGVMLQFDHATSAEGMAEIEGTGWLVGPYYVARYGDVVVDARLLWGRTENEISPLGTYTDTFETERVLAMLNVSGEVERGPVTFRPLFGVTHVDERSEEYVDGMSNVVAAQRVRLSTVETALDWTMPLGGGGTEFVGGLAGLFTAEEGGNTTAEGLRGRIDLGLRRQGAGPLSFDVGVWADGIGQENYEAYGVDLTVDFQF